MPDIRQRFYFANSSVRGEIVQINACLTDIYDRHTYPAAVQNLLGEFVTACVLLTATLKLKGRLSLQARGNGALKMMMAECNHHHQVRAIAQLSEDIACADTSNLNDLLGDGLLVITLEPENGQRYQGIVELIGETLADYLESYFKQSEQLPTHIWLAANGTHAGGLLLQTLPHTQEEDDDRWSRLVQITQTLQAKELLQLTTNEILYRLYHQENVTLPESYTVSFNCTCSRQGTVHALISVGQAECEDILAEQGCIRLNCQFCHNEYVFNLSDIRQLFARQIH